MLSAGSETYLANARQVATFANSDGCMDNGPNLIHDLAPEISAPTTNTASSNRIPIP